MDGVFISMKRPISAVRIRERMAIESADFIAALDFQNFESLMKVFQQYYEKSKEDDDADFPEAILLQRFGSPGGQGTWWHLYHW